MYEIYEVDNFEISWENICRFVVFSLNSINDNV